MFYDVVIVGGGAAGMFAAAACAELAPKLSVVVLEKAARPLAKVRISGGGRCNLTHACHDIRSFVQNYPRGGRELVGPFHRFGPEQTQAWFEERGVPLVTLEDGCVFPRSDSSESEIDALQDSVEQGNVTVRMGTAVRSIRPLAGDGFDVELEEGGCVTGRKVLVATGGGEFVRGLDHVIEPCVPSLFTFGTTDRRLVELSGIVVEDVRLQALGLKAEGSLLITHNGVSGPAVLRLSSFGARVFADENYHFELKVNWCGSLREEQVFDALQAFRVKSPRKQLGTWSPVGVPLRLWKLLLARAGADEVREWGTCPIKEMRRIASQVCGFELRVIGEDPHHEEFVTCGGIRLKEVDFKSMESRLHSGLFFAGEVLDIDALTGGFNLQAAWTTGYCAAQGLLGT